MAMLILSLSLFSFSVSAQVSAAAAPSASLVVTTNGQCGLGVGMTCLGNPNGGQCCSNAGYCGGDDTYCGTGNCQQGYGLCGPSGERSNPISTSSLLLPSGTISATPSPSASSLGTVSPDGSCGGLNGYTCIGYSAGECCSSLGYCGSGPQYCMAGCQSSFGVCSNSNSSSVSRAPMSSSSAMPWNGTMNGTWTSTATVTECDVCEGITSTATTKAPTKSTTFPSPYTGNAAPAAFTFDVKGWLAAGVVGLFGFL